MQILGDALIYSKLLSSYDLVFVSRVSINKYLQIAFLSFSNENYECDKA